MARIRFLDSLRGLAALIVLVHHARTMFPRTFAPGSPWTSVLTHIGRFNTEAVLLFFVLSGFSIRLSIERDGLDNRTALLRYAQRRALRILPLYWFALALSFAVSVVAPLPALAVAWSTLLGNLLFLQTAVGVDGLWFLPYAGDGPLWSLSFEVFYYAAFPALLHAIATRRARLRAVAFATLLGLLASAWHPSPFTLFLGASAIWYAGVELAETHLLGRAACSWGLAFALILLFASAQFGPAARTLYGLWIGSVLFLLGRTLIAYAPALRPLSLALDRPLLAPLARVGDLSYALYLLHVPVLRALHASLGDRLLSIATAVLVSFMLAQLTERAAQRLGQRLLARGTNTARPALSQSSTRWT